MKTLVEKIESSYLNKTLNHFYKTYFMELAQANPQMFPSPPRRNGMPNKKFLAENFAIVFTHQSLFDVFYAKLPEPVRALFSFTTWFGTASLREFQKIEKVRVFPKGLSEYKYSQENLLPEYQWFHLQVASHGGFVGGMPDLGISFPGELRSILKKRMAKPKNYHLNPVTQLPDKVWVNQEPAGPRLLEMARMAHQTQQVRFYANSRKILKSSLKQFKAATGLKEFFEKGTKDLEFVKASLLLEALTCFSWGEFNPETLAFSKSIASMIFKKDFFPFVGLFLTHLNGNDSNRYWLDPDKDIDIDAAQLIRSCLLPLPEGEWIDWENFIDYVFYRELLTQEDTFLYNYRHLYLLHYNPYAYSNKVYVNSDNLFQLVLHPFLRGSFFFFSALGWVDIAYTKPKNPRMCQREKDYLTVFDGLTHVRLTKLGMYMLDREKTYAEEVQSVPESEVVLDPVRLLVTLKGHNLPAQMLLGQIASPIGANRFMVDFASFLKQCRQGSDVKKLIDQCLQTLSPDPPANWKTFFKTAISRVCPLSETDEWEVFEVNDDPYLMQLLTTDPTLRRFVLKAENFHVLIESRHLKKVIKRLEELGFLWGDP